MEVDTDIQGYHHVIFGGDILDWALVSDGILGDHDSHSSGVTASAEAAVASWIHKSSFLAEKLLKGEKPIWDIKLSLAVFGVIDDDHDWNATVFTGIRNEPWTFLNIVSVELKQMSSWSQNSLHIICDVQHVTCTVV